MNEPRLVRAREDLRKSLEVSEGSVALVMTSGNLHEGHIALVDEARRRCNTVVVSIFADPSAAKEADAGNGAHAISADDNIIVRSLAADVELLSQAEVDIIFAPSTDTMYPAGMPHMTIDAGMLAQKFEGRARPGYLGSLCQLAMKLFNLVKPDCVVYGQKNAQELALIRQVVRDFDYGIDVVSVPTVRDGQGIPLSHRYFHLSEDARDKAGALARSLRLGVQEAARSGSAEAVLKATREAADSVEGVEVDYVALVDALSFEALNTVDAKTACLMVAGTFEDNGNPVRFADNALVVLDND